jgi:5-methyltetrahydrofolate--homocysteine methyltransferase
MLLARGLRAGDAPDRMTLELPGTVTAVHAAYVDAGSDAVHANTFGANPLRLAHFGLTDRCRELNERAVALARAAGPRFVIADIGPTGEYLPPVGSGDRNRWEEAFRVQAEALIIAGVDAVHLETLSDVREAEAALDAVRGLDSKLPVLASLTFERKKRGFFTIMGDPLVAALNRLAGHGATGVGANCSITSGDMGELAREALNEVGIPLVFQPNAGQPVFGEIVTYDQKPEDFAAEMLSVVQGGAAAVGGCCGTDPRFIRELRRLMRPE